MPPPDCLTVPAAMSQESYFAALTVIRTPDGSQTQAGDCLAQASAWMLAESEARNGALPPELLELQLMGNLIKAAQVAIEASIVLEGE